MQQQQKKKQGREKVQQAAPPKQQKAAATAGTAKVLLLMRVGWRLPDQAACRCNILSTVIDNCEEDSSSRAYVSVSLKRNGQQAGLVGMPRQAARLAP